MNFVAFVSNIDKHKYILCVVSIKCVFNVLLILLIKINLIYLVLYVNYNSRNL